MYELQSRVNRNFFTVTIGAFSLSEELIEGKNKGKKKNIIVKSNRHPSFG